ncbi:MAG: sugar phosphate isomerase/epimerase family protein [Vicinamibacterales bacterium]
MSHYRYGLSTYLFRADRLDREHLARIAAHGFEALELCTVPSHFDCRDGQAVAHLATWLRETGLELHSVHAPTATGYAGGRRVGPVSIAAADAGRRQDAVAAVRGALDLARHVPFRYLVLHLGTAGEDAPGDNQPRAARQSLEELEAAAAEVNVRLALEILPNALSSPDSLVRMLEEDLDGTRSGICLDFGHAHLLGDLAEAVETVSGHVLTTHVHDNRGSTDEHLVPFAGSIDWDLAVMETQKMGYDGVLMFEPAGADVACVLERSVSARDRLDRLFGAV